MSIKAGDTVRHIPSGEEWLVAAVEGKQLSPCGWPETLAKVDDCELIESCSDEEHWKEVRSWAGMPGYRYLGDWRVSASSRIVEAIDSRECEAIMRT